MSYILVLNGSPRKNGNTSLLVQSFAEGARPHNSVKEISVCDAHIQPCVGCNSCFAREGHACFQHDGMTDIYEALKTTDVLVLASPVYFYGISAQLKAAIDRLHTPLRNDFPLKKLGLILVGAATLPELFDSVQEQYRLALNFFHLESVGTVCAPGCKDRGDVKGTGFLQAAHDLGAAIR